MFTGYDNPADKKVVAELGGKVTEDTHECAGWHPNLITYISVYDELNIRLQCSLPTKCAGRQNSCAWWRRAFLLLDQAGCLKARRPKPFKVGFTSSTVALLFLAFTFHFYYHFQILGYTLSQTRSPRGSGVSVSAGLFERLPRRPCSQTTRFTPPSR